MTIFTESTQLVHRYNIEKNIIISVDKRFSISFFNFHFPREKSFGSFLFLYNITERKSICRRKRKR